MEEENNENTSEFEKRAKLELEKKIRGLTALLESSDSKKTASKTGGNKLDRRSTESGIHIGHRERMRDSARHDGRLDSFSDVELLEYLLSYMVPRKDTNVTAHRLLAKYGSVTAVLNADYSELKRFPCITTQAARILPLLKNICAANRYRIVINSRSDAANFFGAVYIGGADSGTYAGFLDKHNGLIAIELFDFGTPESLRGIVASAVKRGAGKVIFARCDELIDIDFDLSEYIADLYKVLGSVGVELVDFIMFTDYGYYTLCERNKNYGEWVPQYLFIPERSFAKSPQAFCKTHEALDAATDFEDADMAAQLYEYLSRNIRRS